ncbi:MAG: hypothetical protein ACXAEL_14565, partial [Candidatus Hodarchaeales archaeon]
MTDSKQAPSSSPVCRKNPANNPLGINWLSPELLKVSMIISALIIVPLAAFFVLQVIQDDDITPAQITKNSQEDMAPIVFLLDSEDNPHVFWAGWRQPGQWKLYHATRSSPEGEWEVSSCPAIFKRPIWHAAGVFDDDRSIHLVYDHRPADSQYNLRYLVFCNNGSWSKITEIQNEIFYRPVRQLELLYDSETGGLKATYARRESPEFSVKTLEMDSSGQWTLTGQVEIPIIDEFDQFGKFQRLSNNELTIHYFLPLNDTYSDFGTLVCSYYALDSLDFLRNQTFPLKGTTRLYRAFQSPYIGLLESVRGEYVWETYENGVPGMSSCSFDNLSFYVGQSPSDWKRIPLSTDLFYLRYHSLDGVLCENIGTNEYIFVLEALKIPDETQGFYLIRFTMNGTSMEVLSLG